MKQDARHDPVRHRMPRSRPALIVLMLLAAVLFIGFLLLGNWQVRRLHWKLGLIHDVAARVDAAPVAAPALVQGSLAATDKLHYLHVRLRGRFLDRAPILVHGSSSLGYGFWVMAPLRTDRGFIVLVNRGYVSPGLATTELHPPAGELNLTGLLRVSEPGGGFLRPNRPADHQWYSRDVPAMAAALRLPGSAVAPYFVDADGSDPANTTTWPRAGLTVVHFPNNHLGYLITWYLLALGTLAAAVVVGRDEWRLRRDVRRSNRAVD